MVFLGIDIGSSSSKAVLIDGEKNILGQAALNLGTGSNGIRQVLEEIYAKCNVSPGDILYSIVTGYGRTVYKGADAQITEISCHAKGVAHLFPQARTVVDIGGQDAKVICLGEDGSVTDFVMNDKCAAGTGRFLEVMARVLNCDIYDLSTLAVHSTKGIQISSTCTVFAEAEVISQLSIGSSAEDVARGALVSVAKRVCGQAGRVVVAPKVVMTGGVALIHEMVRILENELGVEVFIPESPQTMGALGAALFALERYRKRESK